MPVVEALKREAAREGLDLSLVSYPHEPLEVALRRFAAARKHKLLPALEMLRAHVAWAAKEDLPGLRRLQAHEALGCAPELVRTVESLFPHYHLGHDREGRPITHIYGVNYAAQQLFALVPPDRVGRFHVWRTERTLAEMYARLAAGAVPAPPGQLTAVISVAGMTMRHVTKDFLALVKLLAVIDQNHYPERLGKMYIVGVSRVFFIVWRMVRPWLDAHTASKISFVTSEDAAAVLQEGIDPAQLPQCYGGALAAPWEDGDGLEEVSPPGTPRSSADQGGAASAPAPAQQQGQGSRPPSVSGATPPHAGGSGRANASPLGRPHGSRPASVDWGPGGAPAGAAPQGAAAAHHTRGHSRNLSADLSLRTLRAPTPVGLGPPHGVHHRRMASDDVVSVASWASAMSYDEASDNEFFDAVDLYVEARLAEVEDAAAAVASAGVLHDDGVKAGGGSAVAAKRGEGLLGTSRFSAFVLPRRGSAAQRRMSFELAPPPPVTRTSNTALEPIPEHRVIREVRSRLTRVRILLDCTNVLTCITGCVLVGYGDSPFDPRTLRVFGGVIMTVSLLSIIAGLAVSVSVFSLCLCARECLFGPRVRTETEEGEESERQPGEEAA